MSLVRTLMSATTESLVDVSNYDYSAEASMESYWLDAAMESLVRDIYDVDKAFLTADIIGECAVIADGVDGNVILEGMISNGIDKLKDAWKKFLAKIKEWFAKVKKFFQVLTLKGKDFVKKFGSEIRAKETKGFTYTSYDYDKEAGDKAVKTIFDGVGAEIASILGDTLKAESDDVKSLGSADFTKDASDYEEAVIKKLSKGADSVSEMTKNIEEAYRGGDDNKNDIEDFSGKFKPDRMVSFIENYDKAVKDINDAEKKFEKQVKDVTTALDKLAGVAEKDQDDKVKEAGVYKNASKASAYLTKAMNIQKSAINTQVSMLKEMNGAFTAILKRFVMWKPTKEGFDFEDIDHVLVLTEAADAVEPEIEEVPEVPEVEEGTKESYASSIFEAAYGFIR